MKKYLAPTHYLILLAFFFFTAASQAQPTEYRSPEQVRSWVKQVENKYPDVLSSIKLAWSPGGNPLDIIRIGKPEGENEAPLPSVFVAANLEGDRPLSTEGAIYLAELLLSDPANYDSLNWYILPLGNPDAASRFFESPLVEDSRNDIATNDDLDEQIDEDGPNDLNGDGLITKMRLRHPDGQWIISDSAARLLKKADPKKGEQGEFKIFTEGLDDDGDGKFNEDGPGGTNVAINFPQLFKHHTAEGGKFPGSSPESYAIMKFVFDHPEIAMIVSFGSTNWCAAPPKGGRKGEADLNNIRLSERQANQFSLDRNRTYSLSELLLTLKANNPEMDIDESMLAAYLGLGAALNPQEGDLSFYEKYAAEYKSYLSDQGFAGDRLEAIPARDGSFELWAYFQVGVPVFSMDLWAIPNADSIEREEAMLAYADTKPGTRGFVEWEAFDHPDLGEVEIGGFAPYLCSTPPYEWADSLLNLQLPWILKLAGELPDLHIYDIRSTDKGNGIYLLDVWIENRAYIPFPTDMGSRNRQVAPAILSLEGDQLKFISGYPRTPISRVPGKSRVKTSLIVQMDKPGNIHLKLASPTTGLYQQTIKIGE